MRKTVILTALVLALCALAPILPTARDREIYDKTVRLHVIANSDGDADQALKLSVRDAVLDALEAPLSDVTDRESALAAIEESEERIKESAQAAVAAAGYDYGVELALCEEHYPRKEYEGVALPAGKYLSLQVKIGKSEGKNWWCVLFPTLCTSSASPKEELTKAGFTVGQVRLITDNESARYKLKFRLLELFGG